MKNGSPPRIRLSLSLKRPATHLQKPPQRFGPLTSEEDFRCAAKGVIPLNTKSSNEWALRNLRNWMESVGIITSRKATAFSAMAMVSRFHRRTVPSSLFTKPPEVQTVSAPKISNLIQPIQGLSSVFPIMSVQYESY